MSETEIEPTEDLPVGAAKVGEKTNSPDATPAEEPIDPKLVEKFGAVKLLAKLSRILDNGIFPGGMAGDIVDSLEFIKNMHAPLLHECQQHKDWKRVSQPPQPPAPEPTPIDKQAIAKAEEKRNRKQRRTKTRNKGH